MNEIKEDYRITPKKAWGHFVTITRHRRLVRKYCFRCGLYYQGLTHDLSKYSPSEFLVGARYFQGDRSPNDIERRLYGASGAWMHHKGRNRHHYEFWTDYVIHPGSRPTIDPVPMPNRYILEMLCDRVAAAKIYHPHDYNTSMPLEFLTRNRNDLLMHPETARKLTKLLELYRDQGDTVFDSVRRAIRKL